MAGLFGDTTTTTTTNPILAPGQEGINTAALDIFNQGPLPYYPGQTIAPRDPFQNQAQAGLNNFLTGPGGQSSYTPWYDDGNMMYDVPTGPQPISPYTSTHQSDVMPSGPGGMTGPSQIMGPGGTTPDWVNQLPPAPGNILGGMASTMGTMIPSQQNNSSSFANANPNVDTSVYNQGTGAINQPFAPGGSNADQEAFIKSQYDKYGWGDNYAPGSSWMQDFGSGQSESDIANSFATIAAQQQQDSPYTAQTGMMNQGISAALDRGNIRDVGEYNEQNPYLAQMAQGALTQMGNNFNRNVLPGIRGGEISAGQYGGTRGDIVQGLAASDFGQQAANMLGGLYGTAYESERGRNLQSQIANQSADISAGNMGLTAASMVPALTNQSLGQFSLLDQMGMANRADNQNLINADIDRYNYTQNAPYDALQRYASIINQGNPAGQTRTETLDDGGFSLAGLLGGAAVGSRIGSGIGTGYPGWGAIGGGLLGAYT